MGVVIPFAEIKRSKSVGIAQPQAVAIDHERAIPDALEAGADAAGILAAARPLLEMCRDRYGFVVMRDGLPNEPEVLGHALMELARGLMTLDAAMSAPRTYPAFGVYFGREQLDWFEDGYSGATGLAVPNHTEATDLAAFVLPRVAAARSRSRE
jgi:hypothetical protein